MRDVINQAAPKRNGLPVGELVFIMATNRLLDPRSKYTIVDWYQRTYMPELLGIDLPPDNACQTLTRCLDYLTNDIQMEIEMALAGRVMESFHLKPESFIYDGTSTFVEGEGGADILQYGYSRDLRPDCRQVNYYLCVTMKPTVPLFHQAFPGNTVDSKTVKETIKIRSIWNRTEQHIKAHLFVCLIAYLLYSLLKIEARKEISGITGTKALDRLRRFTERATRRRFMAPTDEELALLSRVSRVR